MNEAAKLWVRSLRSGLFTQTHGKLTDPVADEDCCLGVACKLYNKAHPKVPLVIEDKARSARAYNGETYLLPSRVQEWLGLRSPDGSYYDHDDYGRDLITDNDERANFDEIADIIESEPEGLFLK